MAIEHKDLYSFLVKKGLKGKEAILSTRVTEAHAQEIAVAHCLKWAYLVVHLGFKDSTAIRHDIKTNANYNNEQERRQRFFDVWRERDDATYRALINALLHIDQRADAEFVCELLLGDPSIKGPIQQEGIQKGSHFNRLVCNNSVPMYNPSSKGNVYAMNSGGRGLPN